MEIQNNITVIITKTFFKTSTKALVHNILYCNAKLQMQFGSLWFAFALCICILKIEKSVKDINIHLMGKLISLMVFPILHIPRHQLYFSCTISPA